MFNAGRLAIARKRRQLTKKDLAARARLTALTVTRLENGETTDPAESTVRALADALDYPVQFFYLDECEELTADSVSFRSLSSLSARQRDAALAAGSIAFLFDDWVSNRFELPKPQLLDLRDEDPIGAAEALRGEWGLGTKPIQGMVNLLESKGVRVFALAERHKNVDAYSCWKRGIPYIFLNTFKSAERSRFDAAHELGHLVLHAHCAAAGVDGEREADLFASAFLIHRGDLISNLPRVGSLAQLVEAKKRWGVSVSALARTAYDAGLVSEWHYRDLCKQMSYLGYRSAEPSARERERSILWKMVFENLWRDGITREAVARELHLPMDEIDSLVGELVAATAAPVRTADGIRPRLHAVG